MLRTVMTQRDEPGPTQDVRAQTPTGEPNVQIETLPWYAMAGIRAGRVYLQSVVGLMSVGATGLDTAMGVPLEQFGGAFLVAIKLSVAPAIMSLAQNLLEIFTKLDVTHPGLRA